MNFEEYLLIRHKAHGGQGMQRKSAKDHNSRLNSLIRYNIYSHENLISPQMIAEIQARYKDAPNYERALKYYLEFKRATEQQSEVTKLPSLFELEREGKIKRFEQTITSSATLSDCEDYRFELTREWDPDKPHAAVVMLNPSKADMLKDDLTVMNVTNFLIDKGYGSMTVVNLFAYRATDPADLKYRDQSKEEINDGFLIEAFENADTIIVAWTRTNHKTRKKEVEQILSNYQGKVKAFQDGKKKSPRHPRELGQDWSLTGYRFEFS